MPSRREWIGQRCTNHHRQTPTIHAPGTSRGVHTIRTQGPQSKQTDSQPPPSRPPNSAPLVKSAQNADTSHATSPPALGGNNLDPPPPPNWTHLTTEQPGLATHSHRRLPKRSTSIAAPRTFLEDLPQTNDTPPAHEFERRAMKGKRSQEVVSRTRHL